MGGGSKGASSTTSNKPWNHAIPYMDLMMNEAARVYTGGREIVGYEGNTGPYYQVNPWYSGTRKGGAPMISAGGQVIAPGGMPYQVTEGENGAISFGGLGGKRNRQEYAIGKPIFGDHTGGKIKFYDNDLVADFNPEQIKAQNLIMARAASRGNLLPSGEKEMLKTIQGGYMSPESNPWLSSTYDMALRKAMPSLDTAATKYGAYGGSDYTNAKSRMAGDMATTLYGENYKTERQNQINALSMLPQFQEMDYRDLGMMAQVGDIRQAQAQREIDALREKWDFEQMEPWKRLQLMSDLVARATGSGGAGGTSTTTQPTQSNPVAGALGGAMSGAAMGASVGGPYAWATALGGAVIGGVGGYYSSR